MDMGGILGPIVFMEIATGINILTPFFCGTIILFVMMLILLTIKRE
jgi:hypothetical protein